MLGCIIGATVALGAAAVLCRRRHCGHRYGGCGRSCHGYGRHYRRGWGGDEHGRERWGAGPGFRGYGPHAFVARIADRLDATPDQEKVMHDAVEELLGELRSLKKDAKGTRGDLAGAFGEERLDEERLGELFARHDELLGSARKAFVAALAKIHDVLEPRQREQLSRWLGRGGNFGPYRA
jgi:Spy/CpxP family protein refolding chaperone